MTLEEKQRSLIEDYSLIEDPTERFSAIVDLGRKSPPYPEQERTEAHLVPGCTSRVWLTGWLEEGTAENVCQFRVDSETPSVHGVATMLCTLYSGASPAAVATVEPDFLTALGIDRHLTPTRLRGLGNVRRRIREIAESLEASASS